MKNQKKAIQPDTRKYKTNQSRLLRRVAIVMLLALLTAGCGRSPQTTFYTLTPTEVVLNSSKLTSAAPTIAIASVTLPELVDRPQLVIPVEGTKVAILETQRWAEPLKSAIPRLLANNLSRLIGAGRVSAYPQYAANNADYRLFVDIQRFETLSSTVVVDAIWTIRSAKEGKPVTNHIKIIEPIGTSPAYEAVVAGYSRALATLSQTIARSVTDLQIKE